MAQPDVNIKSRGRDESQGRDEAGSQESGLPREVYALLAQANLQRMRGHWDDAVRNCMAALRLAPDSSSAQSLLGDIYENQGRLDDAVQWYRMALDANPDSPADRLKLDRLLQRDPPAVSADPAKVPAIDIPKSVTRPALIRLLRSDPEMALRYTAVLASLAVLMLLAAAYTVARHGAGLKAIGLASSQEVKAAPVTVPPAAGGLPSDPDVATMRDSSEQSLLTALQNSHALSEQGILVSDVQLDPRTEQLQVTFSMAATVGVTRAQVLRNALRTLEAASSVGGQPISVFTARCLLASTAADTQTAATLAFVGDLPHAALPASAPEETALPDATLSDAQVQALFSNVWWSATADVRA